MYPQKVVVLYLFFPSVLSLAVPTAITKSEIPSLSGDKVSCNKPSDNAIQLDKNNYRTDTEKESIDIELNLIPPLSNLLWNQKTEASVKSDVQEFEYTEAQETINLSDAADTHILQREGDNSKKLAQDKAASEIHNQSNEISSKNRPSLTKRAGLGFARLAGSLGRRLGRTRRIGGSSRGLRKAPSLGRGASRLGKTRTPKARGSKFNKVKTSTSGSKIRDKFSRKKPAKTTDKVSPAISGDKSIDTPLDTKTPAVGNKATTGSAISAGLPAAGDLSNTSGGKGTGPTPASGAAGDNIPVTKKKGGVDDSDDEFDQNEVRQKNQGGGNSGGGSAVAANLAGTVPFLAMPLAGGLMGAGGEGGGNGGDGSGSRGTASADDEEEAPEGAEAQSETETSAKSSQKSSAKAES
ncbi:BgTH12-03787 [Blumeria graminis f. sp. triticale]|uniref:BgTH12-03787 n=1 Tax=Blumeria graminis f. sp. triticale TaxID=1689686 RepID=A0A9W4DD76_BLUGR|nr:BgTH12-03787 [Blumeria graminis f. sp. triticale]